MNVRIEEAIQGIDGIKQIQSPASEGMGTVMIELDLGADARRVVDEVKSNIDAHHHLPDRDREADHPRAHEPAAGRSTSRSPAT